MKIEPYRRPVPRLGVGLVTSTRRVKLEDGSSVRLRDAPKGVRLYIDAHIANMRFLRRGDGWCHAWNDRPVRWFPDLDHEVIMLEGYPGDGDDVLDGLVGWRDHLYANGARVGSPASASMSLLRATIAGPSYFGDVYGADRPHLSQVLGGRQEAFVDPGVYGDFAHLDMSAAYARTLGEMSYPLSGSWVRFYHRLPESEGPTLVRAVVEVPPDIPGPLPARPRRRQPPGFLRYSQTITYPVGRRVQGMWTRGEVENAERHGCRVRVLASWLLSGPPFRPFEAWWRVVSDGRKLPGYASALYKQTGNTLWGQFALDGRRTLDRYLDGRRVSTAASGGRFDPRFGAPDLSEAVASAVRVRLYHDLIVPFAGRVLSVHTDGGLVRGPFSLEDTRSVPNDWRTKHAGASLIYLGPQMYAYRSLGDRGLTYVVSGLPPEVAPQAFSALCRTALGWPPIMTGAQVRAREKVRLERLTAALA